MRCSGDARARALPWADDLAFWGMNVALIGFVIGLMLQSAVLKRISTPVLGVSILVMLVALWLRLGQERSPAPKVTTRA